MGRIASHNGYYQQLSSATECVSHVCACVRATFYACTVLRLLLSDGSPECSLSATRKIMSEIESTHESGLCCEADDKRWNSLSGRISVCFWE